MHTNEVEYWYAWKEDWPDWRPANEVDGLTEMIFRALHVSPPPAPKGTEESSIKIEDSGVKRNAENNLFPQSDSGSIDFTGSEFVLRAKKRFNKRFAITVVGPSGQIFKTFTRDISVGGIFFEHSLPDWAAGYFKVRISKPNTKQKIELTCCLVENQTPGEHYRVAILPLESIQDEKNLEAWFQAA